MYSKLGYIQYIHKHKNFKGEHAPWVIKDENSNKILSSHKTKQEAKRHLQQMKYFKSHKSSSLNSKVENLYDVIVESFRKVISIYSNKQAFSTESLKSLFEIFSILYAIASKIETLLSRNSKNQKILDIYYDYIVKVDKSLSEYKDSSINDMLSILKKIPTIIDAFDLHLEKAAVLVCNMVSYVPYDITHTSNTKESFHISDVKSIISALQELIDKSFALEDVLQGSTNQALILVDKSNVQIREILLQLKQYFSSTHTTSSKLNSEVVKSVSSFLFTTDILLELFLSFEYYQEDLKLLVNTWLTSLTYLISLLDLESIYTNLIQFHDYFIQLSRENFVQTKIS